jgi:hypothetical protein
MTRIAPLACRQRFGVTSLLLAAVLPAAALGQATEKLPAAEQLMDRYIEVAGGKSAYEKLRNRVSTGTIEFSTGVKGPFTTWHAAPNKLVIQVDAEGLGKILEGTDGDVAWTLSAIEGARVKEGVEKAEALRQACFNPELHWRRLYKRAETLSLDNVADKPAYRVEFTPDVGKPMTMYFDKESGLIVKMATVAETPMGEIPVETLISDYRKVDEVMIPHKLVQSVMQQQTTLTTEKIEHNVEIPKTKFDLPVEIRQAQENVKPKPAGDKDGG